MDRQTLAHYGWIVIAALVIAIMLALATPFGKYVMDGVSSVASGYINASNKAMSEENQQAIVDRWEDKWLNNVNTDEGTQKKDPALNPDDGTTPKNGDIYNHNDYKYQYYVNDPYYGTGWKVSINFDVSNMNQASYGAILQSINGEAVTIMDDTFNECVYMTTVPEIPNGVISMSGTFHHCDSFKSIILPESVKYLNNTFYGCTDLENVTISSGVEEMCGTFAHCSNLTNITYKGTMAQWNAIEKVFPDNEYEWNSYCPEIKVICTDGTITIPAWSE